MLNFQRIEHFAQWNLKFRSLFFTKSSRYRQILSSRNYGFSSVIISINTWVDVSDQLRAYFQTRKCLLRQGFKLRTLKAVGAEICCWFHDFHCFKPFCLEFVRYLQFFGHFLTQIIIYMIKTILKCEYESLLSQNLRFKIKCIAKMPNQGVTLT